MAVSAALALLLSKERGFGSGYRMVALSEAAEFMAEPYRAGFTSNGAIVGGGLAEYNLYETADGWIAVAALEPHFRKKMTAGLNVDSLEYGEIQSIFRTKTNSEWVLWARDLDIPLVEVED